MKYHYTKKQLDELMKHLRIVCQTNEKKNEHILKAFDEMGIEYINRSIPEGDYCLMIKACPELGFPLDTYFYDEIFIERKNSLQELASSIYGQKDLSPYVDAVIKEIKAQKLSRPLEMAQIINGLKGVYEVYDDAFKRELKRSINKPYKYLLVEQPNGWDGILNHDYPNKYSEAAYWGALHKLEIQYDLNIKFISRKNMALEIFTICRMLLESRITK